MFEGNVASYYHRLHTLFWAVSKGASCYLWLHNFVGCLLDFRSSRGVASYYHRLHTLFWAVSKGASCYLWLHNFVDFIGFWLSRNVEFGDLTTSIPLFCLLDHRIGRLMKLMRRLIESRFSSNEWFLPITGGDICLEIVWSLWWDCVLMRLGRNLFIQKHCSLVRHHEFGLGWSSDVKGSDIGKWRVGGEVLDWWSWVKASLEKRPR